MASTRAVTAAEDPFSGGGELISVISSWNLSRPGETGYGLVVTKARVIGAKRPESEAEFVVFLGAGSMATEEERARAAVVGSRLLQTRQFVLTKASVAQIVYRRPGFLRGGNVVFKTPLQAFRIDIPTPSRLNDGTLDTSKVLLESLVAFSPERLYDGRTGALYVEERLKRTQDPRD
ncbi:MAG: hypothetical protein OK441_02170 [Thaumarchaeota archaeon]|nr:hypothetical protein [Nitrososphaerota archaeon]